MSQERAIHFILHFCQTMHVIMWHGVSLPLYIYMHASEKVIMNLLVYLTIQVATFIVHKILMKDEGLKYCCAFAPRFYAVDRALAKMLENLADHDQPSHQLLKRIIGCYLRLSQIPRSIKCCAQGLIFGFIFNDFKFRVMKLSIAYYLRLPIEHIIDCMCSCEKAFRLYLFKQGVRTV